MTDTSSNFRIRNHNILYHYVDDDENDVVTVPEGIEYICNNAFTNCRMEEVILPSTVKEIEESAFYYCRKLTTINIPKSVRIIHNTSFDSCNSLSNIKVAEENSNYVFIDGMLCDKKSCELLYCCKTLQGNVTTPPLITKISNRAFSGCKEITELTLSDNITMLQKESLLGLNNLIKLTLPKNLENIEDDIFKDLRKLVFINIDDKNEEIGILDNVIYNRKKSHIFYIPTYKLDVVHISPSLSIITRRNFDGCEIEELIFPENLDVGKLIMPGCEVGLFCFHNCQINKLVIKNKKAKINPDWFVTDWAYDNKDKTLALKYMKSFVYSIYPSQISSTFKKKLLKDIAKLIPLPFCEDEWKEEWCNYLKKSRKKLYSEMLKDRNLLKVFIDKSLLDIEDVKQVIQLTEELNEAELNALLLEYQDKNFSFEEIMKQKEKEFIQMTVIPAPSKKEWNYKIKDDGTIKLTNYKGSNTIVYVPDEIDGHIVNEMGDKSVSPTNGRINEIQKRIRTQITDVYLSDNIEILRSQVFAGCKSLKNLKLPANENCFIVNYDMLDEIKGNFIEDCPSLTKIEVPEGMKILSFGAFRDNPYLEAITLPNSLEEIDPYCFVHCTALKKITLPPKIRVLSSYVFYGCENLEEINLPQHLESISFYPMQYCGKIKELYIPKSVKKIDPKAFINDSMNTSKFRLIVEENSYAHMLAQKWHIPWVLKGFEYK